MKLAPKRIAALSASSIALIGLSATAAGAAVTAPAMTHAATRTQATSPGSLTSVVTGTFTNADGKGTFNGTFTPQKFSVVNGVRWPPDTCVWRPGADRREVRVIDHVHASAR